MNKKIILLVSGIAVVLLVGVFVVTIGNRQVDFGLLSTDKNDNLVQGNVTSSGVKQPVYSNDRSVFAIMKIEDTSDKKICNFYVVNTLTKTETLVYGATETDGCPDFFNIKSFSPNDRYLLIDSGSSPIRVFELVNIDKIISQRVISYPQYMWSTPDDFIFSEPQGSDRPWEDGSGFGISRINLVTGVKVVLKQADDTHDYMFETNPDGSVVSSQEGAWIIMNEYALTDGSEKYLKPKVSHWIMNSNGKTRNNDHFENYHQ